MGRPLTPKEVAKKKKRIKNPDKSVSTERSITVGTDRGFINIPTIVKGKQVSHQDAMRAHRASGIRTKVFKTKEEAVNAAKQRSQDIGLAIRKLKHRRQ